MKKVYAVIVLLAVVLISATAFAQGKPDKELCLVTSSEMVTASSTHKLSYTGVSNGHVLLYGETCYTIPANPPIPEVVDCLPVSGSGILNEGKLEFSVQGSEHNHEFGFGTFTTGIFHVLLDLSSLTGIYATESVTYYEVEPGPMQVESYDQGTVEAVKCPAVPKSELDADKQFKKLIDQLDKL